MEAVNACLGDKLRRLEACNICRLPVQADLGAEPSTVPLKADLLLSGQPVLLEHGDC